LGVLLALWVHQKPPKKWGKRASWRAQIGVVAGLWLLVALPALAQPGAITTCGASDVTAVLQAELNRFSATGGGRFMLPKTPCIVGTHADLTIPRNVTLVGGAFAGGLQPGFAYASAPYTLVVNSAHSVVMGQNSGMQGLNIVRQGLIAPTSLRTQIIAKNSFGGTGIKCDRTGGVTDVNLSELFVVGFHRAAESSCDRVHISKMRGDNTNGIYMHHCGDTCIVENTEFWPFVTDPNQIFGLQLSTVSGAGGLGGRIRVTLAAAPATALVTGDQVVVANVGGVPGAKGRWTITVIDSTHFTLDGSTWSGNYTGGGTVLLNSVVRNGVAYHMADNPGGPRMHSLTEYGYDTGLLLTGTTVGAACVDCWFDGYMDATNPDPVPTGIVMDGATGQNFYSGYINKAGRNVVLNSSSGIFGTLTFHSTHFGCNNAFTGIQPFQVLGGTLQVSGGHIITSGGAQPCIHVADGASSVIFSGVNNIGPARFVYQSAGDCAKVTVDGQVGPCPWTPVLTGWKSGSATPANGFPFGWYTIHGGHVTLYGHISTTALRNMSGNAVVAGFPIAANKDTPSGGICHFGRVAGVSFFTGHTQLVGSITGGFARMELDQIGSGQTVSGTDAATQLAQATELEFFCDYRS